MKQNNKKQSLLFTIPVLAALVFGSIGVSNAFAEDAFFDLTSENVSATNSDAFLEIAPVSPDRQTELQFRGGTDGWAIIGGQAFASQIGLDGNAVYQGNGVWKVKSDAKITVAERNATLELKGKAVDGKLRLHGTGTLENGESFRIILRGHYAPIAGEPNTDFVLDFSAAKIQNMNTGFKIPLVQNGIVHVDPVIPVVDELDDLIAELDALE
ncbi:hypothetical protein [Nitrosopumilus sp. S4]